MRKLLRDKRTGEFFGDSGGWTRDKREACDFYREPERCIEAVQGKASQELEWYFWFQGAEQYDFTTPASVVLKAGRKVRGGQGTG